ncbi:MAG: glycosyltransferase [Acidobacteriota bacterium]
MTIFYLLIGLLVLQGLISLRDGFRYLAYVRRSVAASLPDFTPHVAIIAPCKGLDESMHHYLQSLFELDYPHYQIIFSVESSSDVALAEITHWQARYPDISARCVVAGRSYDRGQKVHNLLAAVADISPEVEALVFVDSDILLPRHWLRALVAPLTDTAVGATTGYRWFIPADHRFVTLLRSSWNGSVATTLGEHNNNFAWGGSMAILRTTFERIEVRRHWQGTVSDDYALTRAVKEAGLYVKFVPTCLVPSLGSCTLRELLEFTTRQIIITRVYSGGLWKLLLISNLLFNLVFFLGGVFALSELIQGHHCLPLILIVIVYLLTVWKGYLRVQAVKLILVNYQKEIVGARWGYYLLAPVVSLIYFYNLIGSIFTNRITWRGITYELRSANKTVILPEN